MSEGDAINSGGDGGGGGGGVGRPANIIDGSEVIPLCIFIFLCIIAGGICMGLRSDTFACVFWNCLIQDNLFVAGATLWCIAAIMALVIVIMSIAQCFI
jgi:hypothetical protein